MATRIKELVTTKTVVGNSLTRNKLTSLEVKIRALGLAGDLACTTKPNDMTAWYCKAYRVLGEYKYAMIVSMAKEGDNPKRLFGWLLKEEMSNV